MKKKNEVDIGASIVYFICGIILIAMYFYIGKYVLCKYYENKIAIQHVVEVSEIPENIRNQLVEKETHDELVLDGIRYIREDLL